MSYTCLDFTFEWNLESLAKISRQDLASPGTRECNLLVCFHKPISHGDKESTSASWDRVPKANRGIVGRQQGSGSEKEKGEGCIWVGMPAGVMELGLGACNHLPLPRSPQAGLTGLLACTERRGWRMGWLPLWSLKPWEALFVCPVPSSHSPGWLRWGHCLFFSLHIAGLTAWQL
jgi:hypothetical protein